MTNSTPDSSKPDHYPIRPYARLLTMLGEQLIKNERIALAEIVKNSYDADASWVVISFQGFGPNFEMGKESKILIEDDGYGMTDEIIKKHWLNPATPGKKIIKGINDTNSKGRKIQGEKGIGRFAILKLGKKAEIVTRPKGSDEEWIVDFDFLKYDDDFLTEDGNEKELFLSDLAIKVTKRSAETIVPHSLKFASDKNRLPHGTRIEISGLKGFWSASKIEAVYKDLSRLQSLYHEHLTKDDLVNQPVGNKSKDAAEETSNVFNFYIYLNDIEQNLRDKYINSLERLLKTSSVLKIEKGRFEPEELQFNFDLDGSPVKLSLRDPNVQALNIFKEYFGAKKGESPLNSYGTSCGPFEFGFYIFDFNATIPSIYALNDEEKAIIKSHRIYLYRDGIRVYPYGDQENDWLRIDAIRGTKSASALFSNDQVVGFLKITQKENPELKDQTNREGLLDTGKPHDDFIKLIQIFLSYQRAHAYAYYLEKNKDKKVVSVYKTEQVKSDLEAAKVAVKDNKTAAALITAAEKNYQSERNYLVQRAETTEDLAAVGMSVETASHDIQSMMGRAMSMIDSVIKKVQNSNIDFGKLFTDLSSIRGMISFIEDQLKDIQLLFKSSKQRRRNIRVLEIVEKVQRIYQNLLDKEKVELEIISIGQPLVAKTTDAVLLQVLLNLFDNAIYWLDVVDVKPKKIEIRLDGESNTLFFSDNGPGIKSEDANFIFEPFFSGKGQAGRGLGLYIARQLLERHEYWIDLADLKANKFLSGANFVVSFMKEK